MATKLPVRVYTIKDMEHDEVEAWKAVCDAFRDTRVFAYNGNDLVYGDSVSCGHLHTSDSYHTAWIRATKYVLDLGCVWGDYVGSDLNRANYLALIESYGQDSFVKIGDFYGSESLGIILGELPDGWDFDMLAGLTHDLKRLEDYPLLDEEVHSQLEHDEAENAWESHLMSDVMSELGGRDYTLDIENRELWSDAYRDDPRETEDIVRDLYYSYEQNEWTFESATSIVNNRSDEAVEHVWESIWAELNPSQSLMAAIHKTASMLDEDVPGWRDRINLDILRMADINLCIAGQAYAKKAQGKLDFWGYPLSGWEVFDESFRSRFESTSEFHTALESSALTSGDWSWTELEGGWKKYLSVS